MTVAPVTGSTLLSLVWLCLCATLLPALAAAEPPTDVVLAAMKEREVVVERVDGAQVIGTLVGFDAATLVVLTGAGAPISVQRVEVSALRGLASASTAGNESAARAVLVRIEPPDPELELHHRVGSAIVSRAGPGLWVSSYELACVAPCNRLVDGSRGEQFFLMVRGFELHPNFRLVERASPVTVAVDFRRMPSPGLLYTGGPMVAAGLIAGLVGVLNLASVPDSPVLSAAILGTGLAVAAGGAALVLLGFGDYSLTITDARDRPVGALKVGLVPPLPGATTAGAVTVGVGF